MDRPEQRGPTDNDADRATGGPTDPEIITAHLRRLWLAGGRDITPTPTDEVVRRRTYLAHPCTDT